MASDVVENQLGALLCGIPITADDLQYVDMDDYVGAGEDARSVSRVVAAAQDGTVHGCRSQ
jgi:hypothetical protein